MGCLGVLVWQLGHGRPLLSLCASKHCSTARADVPIEALLAWAHHSRGVSALALVMCQSNSVQVKWRLHSARLSTLVRNWRSMRQANNMRLPQPASQTYTATSSGPVARPAPFTFSTQNDPQLRPTPPPSSPYYTHLHII